MLEMVKKIYLNGKIDETGLARAVSLGWITEEEAEALMALKG